MNIKSRYWACMVYPDSAPKNWKDILSEMGLVFAVSPLHDKDINPDGTPKKAHWHLLIEFEGPKTYKSIMEEIVSVLNCNTTKKVQSLRGYYRYLAHLDNPEKAQYNPEEIETYGGFKLELTTTETTTIKQKITEYIKENDILEYADLLDSLYEIGDMDYWEVASNHTFFFDKYICSRRNKNKVDKSKKLK